METLSVLLDLWEGNAKDTFITVKQLPVYVMVLFPIIYSLFVCIPNIDWPGSCLNVNCLSIDK